MKRRDFLKLSGLGTFALTVSPQQALEVLPQVIKPVQPFYVFWLQWLELAPGINNTSTGKLVLNRALVQAESRKVAELIMDRTLREKDAAANYRVFHTRG